MLRLNAPSAAVFLVSLILVAIAWVSFFAMIPEIGDHPSLLMTLAYVVLAAGCVHRSGKGGKNP